MKNRDVVETPVTRTLNPVTDPIDDTASSAMPTALPLLDLSLPPIRRVPKSDTEFRVLTLDEIKEFIEPIFTKNAALIPSPESSFFFGAVRDGRVLGWITVQSVIHVEPMYVEPGESALLPRIVSGAKDEVFRVLGQCKVYLTAEDDRVIRLAEYIGMTREPGVAMTMWVDPAMPIPVPQEAA